MKSNTYESKLMQCVATLFGARKTSKYDKKSRMKEVIRCKQAEMCGDYETAYKTLLHIVERNMYASALKRKPSHNLTLLYNIPRECINNDSDVMYATAAVYNLYWMGFPHPCEHFEDWSARFGWNHTDKFHIRQDHKNEHLGELRIITKEEYDNPLKHRPELRCGMDKPVVKSESRMNFYSGEYDDMIVRYKVVDRGWSKHNRVFLECKGHYYEYSWQFCLG
jgi:hypothetical protein